MNPNNTNEEMCDAIVAETMLKLIYDPKMD